MKRFLKHARNNGGAAAILINTSTVLPFAGLALLLNSDRTGIGFGIAFLIIGFYMWTVAYE